ncbi:MAG: hypothetical protein KZQ80_09860 [Candidatus Thiodiazotropha sp. (ex Monitilora ramsayi)]|nr:hypothetical protein [Candidatus Thiodiazotropha sp. (ex Monitilora ramsayi)]
MSDVIFFVNGAFFSANEVIRSASDAIFSVSKVIGFVKGALRLDQYENNFAGDLMDDIKAVFDFAGAAIGWLIHASW